jgi:hypothetical protein
MFKEVSLSSPVYDQITTRVRESYKNACILYVDEVINDDLYSKYIIKKEELETLRGNDNIKELQLFHGTKHDLINVIAAQGFQKKYNRTSAYGIGTYFSPNASMSCYYTNNDDTEVSYMFLCDVLIGICTQVSNQTEINTILYDNSVNALVNPTIYVSPYDQGIYPRYLIAFHKNSGKHY